ncbi:MAG TPA: hypothetical protein PK530_16795 [Anaerolineales bacterium]|nr:hypothetical protein [Anaerolineales bacterium]
MNLEGCKEALLFKNRDVSKTPMKSVINRVNKYLPGKSKAKVESSALQFYLLNQAFGMLTMEVDQKADLNSAQENLAKLYLNTASESSARLFYYILLIITRESRHVYESETLYKALLKEYGTEMVTFLKLIRGCNSSTAVDRLCKHTFTNTTLGQYVACMVDVFIKGKFSGGYGGKPWGNIAETLRKMVYGETSIEIMNDTAWTLAHNNGPMFNKGMLYESYSQEIYKVLDVQRGGMIPQLLAEGGVPKHINTDVKTAMLTVSEVFPTLISGYVDWYKVESLGSLHKYSAEKKAQDAKYGKPKKDKKPTPMETFNAAYKGAKNVKGVAHKDGITTYEYDYENATVKEYSLDDSDTSSTKFWITDLEYARVQVR